VKKKGREILFSLASKGSVSGEKLKNPTPTRSILSRGTTDKEGIVEKVDGMAKGELAAKREQGLSKFAALLRPGNSGGLDKPSDRKHTKKTGGTNAG